MLTNPSKTRKDSPENKQQEVGSALSEKSACFFRRRHGTMTSGSLFEKSLPKNERHSLKKA